MPRMKRTQIYLDHELSEALDRLARKHRTSMASLIRLAARWLVEAEQGEEDAIVGLVGLGNAGPGRVSAEHDRFLAEQHTSRAP